MLKYFGILLIFSGCSFAGFLLALKKKKDICYIEAMIEFIKYIKFKVIYFRSELCEIYDGFDNKFLGNCGYLQRLRKEGMEKVTKEYSGRFFVREHEYEALISFTMSIGKSAWENQVEMCDKLIILLEKYYTELNEKYPNEKKLLSSLGIIAGLLFAVILL